MSFFFFCKPFIFCVYSFISETQFELVLKALGLDDSLISMIVGLALKNTDHITFYVIAAAICYLNQQAAITHQSLQALLYQAHLLMVNPQVVFHVPQLSIDSDLTYEGSTYLHLFGLVKVVNSACGFPIPSFTLNKVYEGTLFYYIRSLIANGKTDKLVPLWGEDSALYEEAEAMSRSVLGTKDVPVRTIRGLKKKETKTSRKSKKAKAKSSSSRGGDKAKNGDKKLCSAFSALCLDDEE